MAKTSKKTQQIDPDQPSAPDYDPSEADPRPGETQEEYMERLDERDRQWKGKQGGEGPSTHDANEHRIPVKISDDWDPHMGNL